jgi:hypothetical protein
MERVEDAILQVGVHVNQKVAAGNQIELRERRVFDDAVGREHAHLADRLDRANFFIVFGKPACQALRRHARRLAVASGAGKRHRAVVDVGTENLHRGRRIARGQCFPDQDGDGIDLLAGGAAWHPDTNVMVGAGAFQDFRNGRCRQGGEGIVVAKKLRHPDQQLAKQQFDLVRVFSQASDIGRHAVDLQNLHAPLHAADQGLLFVLAEIVANPSAQQCADFFEMVGRVEPCPIVALSVGDLLQVLLVIQQPFRHLLDRQDLINQPRRRGALRHPALCGVIGFCLSKRQAALLLDRFQSERAVAAGAGKYDTDRVLSRLLGERRKERIDRAAALARRRGL